MLFLIKSNDAVAGKNGLFLINYPDFETPQN